MACAGAGSRHCLLGAARPANAARFHDQRGVWALLQVGQGIARVPGGCAEDALPRIAGPILSGTGVPRPAYTLATGRGPTVMIQKASSFSAIILPFHRIVPPCSYSRGG